MEKMKTKKEILQGINDSKQFINIEARKLEVLIDIRDQLKIIADYKIEKVQGLRKT